MGRLVILGAGVSGHTAAMHAWRHLKGSHEVVVITPNRKYNWIPSNIWVGAGTMKPESVTFELPDVYTKMGMQLLQAKATELHPEGTSDDHRPFVSFIRTDESRAGEVGQIHYDYLINATGPKLNFEQTPGLGPDKGHTTSVCTYGHAAHAWERLDESIQRMKAGERQKILIGTGHGNCTCQGAAFEYMFNVEHAIRKAGVRDKADLQWVSNEYALGDFGMGGMHLRQGGYVTPGRIFAESLFAERGVDWLTQAAVTDIQDGVAHYETLTGDEGDLEFDFAMLLPPFSGVGLKAFGRDGADITSTLFAPNGFMKVDADYSAKAYEDWSPQDWPETYQNPTFKNVFAVGIAFAPPHPISKPMKNPKGTPIFPTPPRTGMPSGVIGRQTALNIVDMMKGDAEEPMRKSSMARMGAACLASVGKGFWDGSAVSMTVYPIVPDYGRFPETGRSLQYTSGEIGLAGHWIKHLLHHGFIYKAKANPLWHLIPE
jgi:sulfide:quinone oxidoreductase